MGTSTMLSVASMRLRQSIAVKTDQQIILRKTNSINSGNVAVSLITVGAVSIGDVSVDAQSSGGSKLKGTVVAGAKFKFGLSGQEYTLTGESKADNSGVIHLTFLPRATAGISPGSALNFTVSHADYLCPVLTFPIDVSQTSLVEGTKQQKIIPASDNYPAPDDNDQLGGSMVLKVVVLDVNGVGYYHCYLGK